MNFGLREKGLIKKFGVVRQHDISLISANSSHTSHTP